MDQFAPLILFAITMTFSPGAATVLASGSGARFGIRTTMPLIMGMSFALALLAGLSGLGVTQMLEAFPWLKIGLTIFGSVYFIWLAWKVLNSGSPASMQNTDRIGFAPAALMLLLNPKAWAMTAGAAATFGSLALGHQLSLIMALVFGVSCAASMLVWALGGAAIGRKIRAAHHWYFINGIIAMALLGSLIPLWRPLFELAF